MTAHPTKEAAIQSLERARADYLDLARTAAGILALDRELLTVNDVRAVCPPPPDIDPRVMGAIFKGPHWEPAGFVNSERGTCHRRPIRQFRRVGI